jgi:hypothetical protein
MGEVISPSHNRTPTTVGNPEDIDGVPTLDRSPSYDSDQDHDLDLDDEHDSSQATGIKQEPAPPQKRKGGRKPVGVYQSRAKSGY